MSASEKLKALDARVFDSQEDVEALLTALPEIIAVVEAAELTEDTYSYEGRYLSVELAKLEKKLS